MNQPWVYICPPSQTSLPPPSPSHPSGLSQCTGFGFECPVSCIKLGLVIYFTHKSLYGHTFSLLSDKHLRVERLSFVLDDHSTFKETDKLFQTECIIFYSASNA